MTVGVEKALSMGMESGKVVDLPWFRFVAQVEEDTKAGVQVHDIDVRMVYDPKQHLGQVPVDLSGARELFRWSLGAVAMYSRIVNEYPGQDLFQEMFMRQRVSGVPMTVLLAHGGVNAYRKAIVIVDGHGRAFEEYRKSIEALDRKLNYKVGVQTVEPSVILYGVCGSEDPYYEIPDNDSSVVYYRGGIVGLLRGTGKFKCSRKS